MSVDIDRMLQDIQEFSVVVQGNIGRAIEKSTGYVTTPETNAFLMYAILALLIVVFMRIFSSPRGQVKAAAKPRSKIGYDFGRYG